jgi:hypothetical protein
MNLLYDRRRFQPMHKCALNSTEMNPAVESSIFLVEKRNGTLNARHYYVNGSTQLDSMRRERVSSPTLRTESGILLTAVTAAQEGLDAAKCAIPNALFLTDKHLQGRRKFLINRSSLD